MKNFALTGVAGYIAPRHLQAIYDTGNRLVAAVDVHDSVGILDRYFPGASFFTQFERYDRHAEKLRFAGHPDKIDLVSICSPNYLHDAHIRHALRIGADALCEKPLVLNPWNLDALEEMEREYEKKVFNILQLRVHPSLIALKKELLHNPPRKRPSVRLSYITSRGLWYHYSWKGDISKSGGIGTNIGIHFFDMLMWFFGRPRQSHVHLREPNRMGGYLELEDADVSWYLSLDRNDLPPSAAEKGQPTFRSITIDGKELEFSGGFTDLHTRVYEETLTGRGFGLNEARPSIELAHHIRTAPLSEKGEKSPFLS
ncbi:UDP-N-acetyl-2-amino-2-deoxyglucuronate dehydrogenase [Cyclonatronum proteinivorum]|uniref:UDP-N-acetyl-2-amino-2-deoxyglucuronate dehydrogenase n=1 Tax=Cyclonatronum proteinivorum TaxID=1457365 RepID=A0A345UQ04_9BACT|nr:Gfo/Idh/MocA family oxidoreductase [Cyclonatronum proteinivorum]AXJ02556.1 UDP-N-acetyl-2-amino-2-deoxyglucuronate dehydrogenase [Cyclonatronum proteinivorum]